MWLIVVTASLTGDLEVIPASIQQLASEYYISILFLYIYIYTIYIEFVYSLNRNVIHFDNRLKSILESNQEFELIFKTKKQEFG